MDDRDVGGVLGRARRTRITLAFSHGPIEESIMRRAPRKGTTRSTCRLVRATTARPTGVGHHRRLAFGRRSLTAAAPAGIAYAVGASFTRPFTLAADVMTAVVLVAAVVLTIRTISGDRRTHGDDPVSGGAAIEWSRWWVAWIAAIAAVCAWELYCFVHLPRSNTPR